MGFNSGFKGLMLVLLSYLYPPPLLHTSKFLIIYFFFLTFPILRLPLLFVLEPLVFIHLSFFALISFVSRLYLVFFSSTFSFRIFHVRYALFPVLSFCYRVIWNSWRSCQIRLQFLSSVPQHASHCLTPLFCRRLAASRIAERENVADVELRDVKVLTTIRMNPQLPGSSLTKLQTWRTPPLVHGKARLHHQRRNLSMKPSALNRRTLVLTATALKAMISMRTVNLKAAHRGRNSMVSTNSDVTCICLSFRLSTYLIS